MSRLTMIAPDETTGALKEAFGHIKRLNGRVTNLFQAIANSPAILTGYFSLAAELDKGELYRTDRELVYLAVSESNGSTYCVSAHTMIATAQVGLKENDVLAARRFLSTDRKRAALLEFVRRVMETKGAVSDRELSEVRQAGYTDGQITEVIAHIGLATFENLFSRVHDTPLDFPPARKLSETHLAVDG